MSKHIKIFDTTLRDGEQSPGCSMNQKEKLEIASQLERLGVDVIEAGFAISSKGDFESIEAISEKLTRPTICSLCRTKKEDIELAARSIAKAKHQRIHTFIATSPIHMEHKLKMTPDVVLATAVEAVKYAKTFVNDVEFSCEDAGRSDWDFLVKVFTEVIAAGATVVNVPDTVGFLTPGEYGLLIKHLADNVPNIDTVDISVHCHDDLGLATANALEGVRQGATQIECTINGIGERAGNTALEEVVMAIRTRDEHFESHTLINTQEILKTSKLVSAITGSVVQPNKAIVGANAFAHEAGIHQDGVIKKKITYEIMDAELIGLKESNLVLGKHSGRHAFLQKLQEMDYSLENTDFEKAFERFKALADKKKEIRDEDIEAIINDELFQPTEYYKLEYVQAVAGNTTRPTAAVQLETPKGLLEGSELGSGPIDAIYKTIDALIGEPIQLVDFVIHSITGGTDALGEVSVRIKDGDTIFSGRGANIDVMVAAAKAYVTAINKMQDARESRSKKNRKG